MKGTFLSEIRIGEMEKKRRTALAGLTTNNLHTFVVNAARHVLKLFIFVKDFE